MALRKLQCHTGSCCCGSLKLRTQVLRVRG